MKLTENFTLEEFTRSAVAEKYGIENEPDAVQQEKIKTLCEKLLQPLRDRVGIPLTIGSGFRAPELNAHPEIDGAASSQHTLGEAADIHVPDPLGLLKEMLFAALYFDQAILYPTFLHLSYREGRNRRQVLYAKGVKP